METFYMFRSGDEIFLRDIVFFGVQTLATLYSFNVYLIYPVYARALHEALVIGFKGKSSSHTQRTLKH